MPFIDDITCTIYDMSSTVYDIIFTLCVTLHNACISDITHSMFMTYPLYMASHTVLWQHNDCVNSQPLCLTSHPLCLCHHTHWINFIKPSVCMTPQPLCVWHQIHSLGHHNPLCMTSGPLYLTSLPLNLCHQTHSMDDITATICMSSNPVYLWYHILYIYDKISTKYDITTLYVDDATLSIYMTLFALQIKLHPRYHTKPQYLWCHIQFRHDNTSPVSDIKPTISISSYHLHWHLTHFCMTSHPLLCDIICTIYNITPDPYVITLLYLWHHNLYILNHIKYEENFYT